jgi:Fic family protein
LKKNIYTVQLSIDFHIINNLSGIDRFDAEWAGIERRERLQTLKELKSIATVHSVGASTRIEGSKMTDNEVHQFIFNNLKTEKLVARDQQEVLGYFTALDIISGSYQDIEITENSLKHLHNILMKFSDKDQWHKGNYKKHSNSVEATNPDGSKIVLFNTTPPGIETEDAMRALVNWYNADTETPAIIKSALFVYDFLSIHPFQDGNGRLSRLLGTLLLLKHGYSWIQYVSFEHEIENRKTDYYRILMDCQQKRPGEDITSWMLFFLNCLGSIQINLRKKLEVQKSENQLSPRNKMIYTFVENHPGCKSGEIAQKLNIPLPTVKKILADMVAGNFLGKYGTGAGTNYTTEKLTVIKTDVAQKFTEEIESKEYILANRYAFIAIKKIILHPKFQWQEPREWADVLFDQNLELSIICTTNKGEIRAQQYCLEMFDTGYYYRPVFSLNTPIHLPLSVWSREPFDNEFPIRVLLQLTCNEPELKFDTTLVMDTSLE